MVPVGNVVKDYYIGHVHVRICDDYCRDKTQEEVDEILKRIARNAIGPLTVAAIQAEQESEQSDS